MKFLYITYIDKKYIENGLKSEQQLKRIHSAPIEHPIVYWVQDNLKVVGENGIILYYDFPKGKVEGLYNILVNAHAEKCKESPRPWKFLPHPSEERYAYPITPYEKEYGTTYYESLYKYITAIGVMLNILDFNANQLIIYIK